MYKRAMLNIHPALLPNFGGRGFYGSKVHTAVIQSGARFSGPTVHFVDEGYALSQARTALRIRAGSLPGKKWGPSKPCHAEHLSLDAPAIWSFLKHFGCICSCTSLRACQGEACGGSQTRAFIL